MWICIIFCMLILIVLPEILELIFFNADKSKSCVKTFYLVKLKTKTEANDFEQRYYIKVVGNKAVFTFNESKNYIQTYKEGKVKGKILVHEQDEIRKPMLRVFQNLPSFNLGVFTPVIAKTEYHFYIPKGTALNLNKC